MPWQEIIGILGTTIMASLGIAGWVRNSRGDASSSGKDSAIVVTKLEGVQAGIEEIKSRLDRRDREYVNVIARLTNLETTIQDILRRLDRLENK